MSGQRKIAGRPREMRGGPIRGSKRLAAFLDRVGPRSFASLRERPVTFAGSFVALCLGVAILTMSALVLLSGGSGVPERFAGTPLVVQSGQGSAGSGVFLEKYPFSPERADELKRELAALPGVSRAIPDHAFYAQALIDGKPAGEQTKGDRLGHGWSSAALAPYRLAAGQAPRQPDEVALDRSLGLAPGAPVTLLTAEGPAKFTVSGTVDGPGYYLTDTRAAQLSGGTRVIGLLTGKGADQARVGADAKSLVGDSGTVLGGQAREALAPPRDEQTRWIGGQVVAAMAALSAFVTVFVIASTFAFTVAQRRREFGMLRTIGATPRQLRRMLHGEALAIGTAGSATGVLLGAIAAPWLGGLLVDAGFLPRGFEVRTPPWALAAAFAVGVGVALAGVWSASRKAAGIAPLEALREAAVDDRPLTRSRLITGLAFTGLGLCTAVASASADPADMITLSLVTAVGLITGVTLLVPAIAPPLVRLVSWPLSRSSGAAAVLVREGMLTAVRRTAATIAPVLATVAFVVLITGNTQTSANSYAAEGQASVHAEASVVPDGTPGLTDAAVARVEGTALLPTTVYGGAGHQAFEGAGIDPRTFRAVHNRVEVTAGALDGLEAPDTVAVTRSLLTTLDAKPGGTAEFTFEDGRTARLRIVAVLDDRSAPYGALFARQTVRAHDPSALTEVVHRTGPAESQLPVGAQEISVAAYAGQEDAEEDRLVWVFTLLLVALSAGYTGLAVGNTLLMATAGRAGDFQVLRRSGALPRQVLRTVAGETAFVVGLGTLLGGLVALPSLLGIRAGLSGTLGIPVELVVPWAPVLGAVGGCLVLALAASVLPARRAMRRGGV
ncbi:FtsX-like permease family protein [Streptomyces sp. NBC_01304]|uniref:FtsX-like permease family protein n=1 Tax=Streptomyces sp. NBC_01304 TaxID=2903818 RepID=UPI002E1452B4|nr:ABC transporter permease [Streptomyces sp. NBC_01304]